VKSIKTSKPPIPINKFELSSTVIPC